jgi:quercetin dioxygenase-like cupin family protein
MRHIISSADRASSAKGGGMKGRLSWLAAMAAAMTIVALAAFVAVTNAEPPMGVRATVLARGTYDSFNVRSDPHGTIADFRAHSTAPIDLIVRQHDYDPHSTTGWHSHPGPVFITVTRGTLTFYEYDDPCTPHVVSANSANNAFVDDGKGHVVRNETDQPAQDISVITAPVGGTFRTNLDPPNANC